MKIPSGPTKNKVIEPTMIHHDPPSFTTLSHSPRNTTITQPSSMVSCCFTCQTPRRCSVASRRGELDPPRRLKPPKRPAQPPKPKLQDFKAEQPKYAEVPRVGPWPGGNWGPRHGTWDIMGMTTVGWVEPVMFFSDLEADFFVGKM